MGVEECIVEECEGEKEKGELGNMHTHIPLNPSSFDKKGSQRTQK
jgi:hypothetical protein